MPRMLFNDYVHAHEQGRFLDDEGVVVTDGPVTQFPPGTRGYCDFGRRRMVVHREGAWVVRTLPHQVANPPRFVGVNEEMFMPRMIDLEVVNRWTMNCLE